MRGQSRPRADQQREFATVFSLQMASVLPERWAIRTDVGEAKSVPIYRRVLGNMFFKGMEHNGGGSGILHSLGSNLSWQGLN